MTYFQFRTSATPAIGPPQKERNNAKVQVL